MQRARDRRRAGRFPLELEALIQGESSSFEEGANVLIRNISSRGALFSSPGEAWERGQPVSVNIKMGGKFGPPYSYDLRLRGRIVRQDHLLNGEENRFAVEFDRGWKVDRSGA
jgi:hypothetical protein